MLDTNIISDIFKLFPNQNVFIFSKLIDDIQANYPIIRTTTTQHGFKQTSATAWKKKTPRLTSKTHRLLPSQSQTTWSL